MSKGLLYLENPLTDETLTVDLTPVFDSKPKPIMVTASIYLGKLEEEELEDTEPEAVLTLDLTGWADFLAWVHAAFEAKRIGGKP